MATKSKRPARTASVELEHCFGLAEALKLAATDTVSYADDPSPAQVRAVIDSELSALDERERLVLTTLYLEGQTFRTCAERFNVSTTRIRQIKDRALRRLHYPAKLRRLAALRPSN